MKFQIRPLMLCSVIEAVTTVMSGTMELVLVSLSMMHRASKSSSARYAKVGSSHAFSLGLLTVTDTLCMISYK